MAGSTSESAFHTPQYPDDVIEMTAGACEEPIKESDRTRPGCPSDFLLAETDALASSAGPTERHVTNAGGRGGQGGGRADLRSKTDQVLWMCM